MVTFVHRVVIELDELDYAGSPGVRRDQDEGETSLVLRAYCWPSVGQLAVSQRVSVHYLIWPMVGSK